MDGASNENMSGAGVRLITPEGHQLCAAIRFKLLTSNNGAEFEALLTVLKIVKELHTMTIEVCTYLKLVEGHMNEEYHTKDEWMAKYVRRAMEEMLGFERAELVMIMREQNAYADFLAKATSIPFLL